MAELGLAGAGPADTLPFSPRAAAMPLEPPLGRRRSAGEAGIGEAQHKPQRSSLVGRIFRPNLRRSMVVHPPPETRVYADPRHPDEYNEQLVDWLDIIDPEVQTLSTLTNVQNSLFVPDLGSWVNRRPTYVLSQPVPRRDVVPPPEEPSIREEQESEGDVRGREEEEEEEEEARPREVEGAPKPRVGRSDTISSRLSDSHYAALPHGETLEGWTAAEKWELDDHVRHMMHSRRSKFKRQMKGFGQYVRRPLGFFVTLYATLITLFGLAWVLFLIGWIYVGEEQVYAIHIIDSVLVALFAIMGDGLAPFRAIDTYHMIFIVRYCRIIAKAKKKAAKGLARPEPGAGAAGQTQGEPDKPGEDTSQWPGLRQGNNTQVAPSVAVDEDKPDSLPIASDLEDAKSTVSSHSPEMDYLTPKQRRSLQHHQKKLSKSHSFYKPHETLTHHAFPLGRLVAIIILLDCHSCLQISLGACTWGIDYHHRPFALTTVILCVSITCNLTAGLVIMFGDRKTRKKDVVELLNRQALTGDAIKKVEKKRGKQGQETDNDSERFLTGQNGANN
ncbi:hypothetical protein UVI_02014420 [Ustilaginoidea virens]|nr:hypothetical protein UVI_02014420 [Ustilaginoidea virens]